MFRSEFERHLLARRPFWFDASVSDDATTQHLSAQKIRDFLRDARDKRNLGISLRTSVSETLRKLKLLTDAGLTNAAVLLFGKEPQWHLLCSEVRCARFSGKDVTESFIDMKVLRGSIINQVDDAERFVLNNIRRAAWVTPGQVARQERWEYPPEAIREAITNAIVHRDYRSPSNVQVRIFDDRLEVWNPGTLPPGLTPQMLMNKHESVPVNPLLAGMFFLIGYVEQWGTGTNKIVNLCRRNGNPDPEFEDTGNSVVVTFRLPPELISESVIELPEGLDDRELKVMEHVRRVGYITNSMCRQLMQVSDAAASKLLRKLREKGFLKIEGRGRATRYIAIPHGIVGERVGERVGEKVGEKVDESGTE